jgi:MraZ protein
VEEKGLTELLGQHRYQLDGKGRIALPAKYRDVFVEGVYLTLGQDGCLYAYPKEEWERRSAEVKNTPLPGREGRDWSRIWFSFAQRVDLDRQGRFVIPQVLRTRLGDPGDVVVLGVGERLEIWSGEGWEQHEASLVQGYVNGSLDFHGR